jgi:hypothetical protein
MIDAIQLRDNARYQLEQIKDLESGIDYLNKVKAIETWVKAEKKDAELQNMIAEQKIRTQRILGQLLKDSENGQGMRSDLVDTNDQVKHKTTLSDYGITKDQSSTFQQIAEIPEEIFEEFIEEKKAKVNEAVKELTTTGALRLAKNLKEKKKDLKATLDIKKRLEIEHDLKNIATDLRSKYNRKQIEMLIKFLTN